MLALSPSEFNLSLTRALALGLHAVVATLSKPDASLAERRWATSALFRFKPLPLADPIATRPSLAPTPPIVASIETMSIAPAPSSSAEPHIASSAQTAPASKLLKTFSPCGPVAQASRLGVPSPQTLGPRPAAPSLASAPLELAPAPTAEAGAIVTPSAPSISDECEALLTLL
ncbi:MAG: hypothetical protein H7Y88_09220, partial [Phycisphaerales bacterium]|nr:hypothetical protein [Phycisphaerales bacterium]